MKAILYPFRAAALAGFCLLSLSPAAWAQNTFVVDPPDPLAGFTSLAEWETADDAQGWTTVQATTAVMGGVLSGTTDGIDPQISRLPLPTAFPSPLVTVNVIEIKVRRSIGDTTPFQVYWTDSTGAGALAEARSVVVAASNIPNDGNPHVIRLTLKNTVATDLRGLRVDPTQTQGSAFELDYVRLKNTPGSVIDPPANQQLNAYTSLGEFNTDGAFEGWNRNTHITPASFVVGQGFLSGTTGPTSFNDPTLTRTGLSLDTTGGSFPILEIRLRKDSNDASRVDLFRADGTGGIGGGATPRFAPTVWPLDGAFHVLQFNLSNAASGIITAFRLDPIADKTIPQNFTIDYIRLGRVLPDTDGDGLADAVETKTGIFVSAADTGSDPAKADTDGDTFSDGVEVAFGSDPNNATLFPAPLLNAYTSSPAVYVRNVAIASNNPGVINGTPVSYSVSPPLPAGLVLSTTTGIISGTPTTVTPVAAYTVTAQFAGGITSNYPLSLEVRDPGISGYTFNQPAYRKNRAITGNAPLLIGPAPTGWSVAPALPDGLFLDGLTGVISGTPATRSDPAAYTITATYSGYPDATFPLTLGVLDSPVFRGTDLPPLDLFTSFGEWQTDGAAEGWAFTNSSGVVAGGSLTNTTTAVDPQMARAALAYNPAGGTILEIRLRQADTAEVQIFWGDGTGGIAGERSITITPSQIIGDGQFHTYQLNFDGVFLNNLTNLRIDPGNTVGRVVDFDYVRIGTAPAETGPVFTNFTYDPLFREAQLTWSSTSGVSYNIEATPDLALPRPWQVVGTVLANGRTTSFTDNVPVGTPKRFYLIKPLP